MTSTHPLSPAQRRMWFLHELAPTTPAYNICTSIALTGALRPIALRALVRRLGARHDALRTVFEAAGDSPRQRVTGRAAPLRTVELGHLSERDQQAQTARVLRQIAARPFPLETGPLVEWTLLSRGPGRHTLVLSAHHLVFDGGSLAVLCQELERGYGAALAGAPDGMGSCAPSHARQCASPAGEADPVGVDFWRRELADAPPRTAFFRGRPERAGRPPARVTVRYGWGELREPAAFCRGEGATTPMLLLAALACLAGRYTGQRDVVLGTPVGTREDAEQLGTVGPMINLLPLRIRLHGDPGFREVLARTRSALLNALDHRKTPFEEIVDAVGAGREPALSPLFQVLFTHQRHPAPPALPGVRTEVVPVAAAAAKYDLSVTAVESAEGLEMILEAEDGHCGTTELTALADHVNALLAAAVRAPDTPFSCLPLLPGAERRRLARHRPTPHERAVSVLPLHRMVERSAARHPDALAVVSGSGHLSYQAFNTSANRRAARLRRAGAGPETVVGVWLERGPELLVSLLAVLKAGAAYLPIDPRLPARRVRLMLADASASLLITETGLSQSLGPCGVPLHHTDELAPSPRPGDETDRVGDIPLTALAYLLYTSGSTGRPKGVAVQHDSAAAFVRWAGAEFGAEELAAVLATTSVGFDLSVFEIFAPLAHGGTVLLADSALHVPALPWAPAATLLNTVPSAAAALLETGGLPTALSAVNLAGEPLSRELADQLYDRVPGVAVRNLYGPSETTTYATSALVPPASAEQPTIGRAAGSSRVWTADKWMRPVPGPVLGELLIAGGSPARGYLGQPGATAGAFRPDPFGPPGGRLYRTGDLARRRPDGEFLFAGRSDTQIKLRGVRVEPGEVEAALRACPGVVEAAVVVAGTAVEHRRLVGFLTTQPGQLVDPAQVLGRLRAQLPAVFVPSELVVEEALPRTTHGKTDRARLAASAAQHRPRARQDAPPRNRLEAEVARVWSEVLGLERVSIHDAFFDLGGNSLTMLRLHRRLVETLRADLRLVDVFRLPTVAALAAYIAAPQPPGAPDDPVVSTAGRRGARRRAVASTRRRGGASQ